MPAFFLCHPSPSGGQSRQLLEYRQLLHSQTRRFRHGSRLDLAYIPYLRQNLPLLIATVADKFTLAGLVKRWRLLDFSRDGFAYEDGPSSRGDTWSNLELHANNLVFGDLRAPNIALCKDPMYSKGAVLVDFDWCGRPDINTTLWSGTKVYSPMERFCVSMTCVWLVRGQLQRSGFQLMALRTLFMCLHLPWTNASAVYQSRTRALPFFFALCALLTLNFLYPSTPIVLSLFCSFLCLNILIASYMLGHCSNHKILRWTGLVTILHMRILIYTRFPSYTVGYRSMDRKSNVIYIRVTCMLGALYSLAPSQNHLVLILYCSRTRPTPLQNILLPRLVQHHSLPT